MVDDMKKLVEKYKRELMEYSKAAVPEKPAPLTFPEMIKEPEKISQPVKETEYAKSSVIEKSSGNYRVMTEKEFSELHENNGAKPDNVKESLSVPTAAPISDNSSSAPITVTDPAPDYKPDNETPENSRGNAAVNDIPETRGYENWNQNAQSDNETRNIPELRASSPEIINSQQPNNISNDAIGNVPPEDTQRLSDPPISGLDPEEQLGRRDFEDEQQTVNSRSDIKPLVQNETERREMKEPDYSSIEEFNNNNTRRGSLRFRVYTARGALPVPNASIQITKNIGDRTHIFYNLKTDISGAAPTVYLPAPYAELSQNPENTIQPYSLYEAFIKADGYGDIYISNIPIFEGIQSDQNVAMVPSSPNNIPDRINESEPNLNGGT